MKSALYIIIGYIVSTVGCQDNKIENAKKQEFQHDDELLQIPTVIKAEDAIKILENNNKTHSEDSVALIKQLQWLMSTFNVTELFIDDTQSDAFNVSSSELSGNSSNIEKKRQSSELSGNSSNIERKRHSSELSENSSNIGNNRHSSQLRGNSSNIGRRQRFKTTKKEVDSYYHLKQAIISHWSFTTKLPHNSMDSDNMAQSVKEGLKYMEEFLAKHNINLEKPIPKRFENY